MPKGKWTPPEAGDAPQEVKDILKKVYSEYRDKHPGEDEATKTAGAKIAWKAVHDAGYSKNAEGKWEKKKKEMSEAEMDKIPQSEWLALAKFAEEKPKPYGDVEYADPKNGKYPIDTEEHIRAAWNYINKEKNANQYGDKGAAVKAKIIAAWKKKIDKEGPPAAKEMSEEIEIDAFKTGDYPQGKFGDKELCEVAETYNPDMYEAPILIGHLSDPSYEGKSAIPAFGWIGAIKKVGNHLKFVASQFSDELKAFIKKGLYKKVSAAFYEPTDKSNPTPGKWHLHHLAFLGGMPPQVKGLEQIAFAELRASGIEFQETDATVTEGGKEIEVAEEIGTEDTLTDLAECCASCMSKIEDCVNSDIDKDVCKERCNLALLDMQTECQNILNMHFMFLEKLENIEEHKETEMSEKKSTVVKFMQKLFSIKNKQKEQKMDAKLEQGYKDQIAERDAKITAFEEEKTRIENEAKEQTQKTAIATFCDAAIKDGRMSPAQREKDEPLMLTLAKTNGEALVAFQEKYKEKVVPLGEVNINAGAPASTVKTKLEKAADYVNVHSTDKEFSDCSTAQDKMNRAVYLESIGKITFPK